MSYDDQDLTGTGTTAVRNRVRLEIGDTDPARHILSDAEVDHLVTVAGGNEPMAALESVRRILARLTRDYDRSAGGGTSNSRSQKTQFYRDLLRDLREKVAGGAQIHLTGHSVSEVNALLADSDFPSPSFRVGMHDHDSGQSPDWDPDD